MNTGIVPPANLFRVYLSGLWKTGTTIGWNLDGITLEVSAGDSSINPIIPWAYDGPDPGLKSAFGLLARGQAGTVDGACPFPGKAAGGSPFDYDKLYPPK